VSEPASPYLDLERNDYDEFQFLEGHAVWAGLPWRGRPAVVREELRVEGRTVSFLRWGQGEPGLVLLHGAGQNAHTWDTFVMALDRSVVAVDLPGHGRSDWRVDRDYSPRTNARALGAVVEAVAPNARGVVGMSLGGLTAIRLAAGRPDLVRTLVLVDITPAIRPMAPGAPLTPVGLLAGPRRYGSWDELLDSAHAHMPHRDRGSIVPGLRHNVRRFDDGSWGWRYDQLFREGDPRADHAPLWNDIASLAVDVLLVKGGRSTMVDDEAIAELHRRNVRVEVVAQSGHAVQSDAPVELARLVEAFVR
jgi:pimeloyl-ACP methyl ester carboxylesterase